MRFPVRLHLLFYVSALLIPTPIVQNTASSVNFLPRHIRRQDRNALLRGDHHQNALHIVGPEQNAEISTFG